MRSSQLPTQPIALPRITPTPVEPLPGPAALAGIIWKTAGGCAAITVAVLAGGAALAAPWWLPAVLVTGIWAGVVWWMRQLVEEIKQQEASRLEVLQRAAAQINQTEARLSPQHPDAEALNAAFDLLAERINEGRTRVSLFDTVINAAPMAIVVCDYRGEVIISNRTANDLLWQGKSLVGEDFEYVLAQCPEDMARAVRSQADELFTVDQGDEEQAYHVSMPSFDLNQHRYTVYLIKQLTRELSRQEVAIWKKMIRVISHELNNSLAPVSSLIHSARLILNKPEHSDKLERILDIIEERAKHLSTFLEGYARFARLAPPERRAVAWGPFLKNICELQRCALRGSVPALKGWIDPAQVEQALINLIKNAMESGSPSEEVILEAERIGDGVRISVLDRGRGMKEDVIRQALLPFYSTKKQGSGLGLSLCREIADAHDGNLRLEQREGGGTMAHLWLPGVSESVTTD